MQTVGTRSGKDRRRTVAYSALSVIPVLLCTATTAYDRQYSSAIAEFGTAAASVEQQTRSAYNCAVLIAARIES